MPVSAVAVAVVAVLGALAGRNARALADGFYLDDEHPGDQHPGGQHFDGQHLDPAAVRAEARDAFAAAIRTAPVPRQPYLIEGFCALSCGLVAWRFWGDPLLLVMVYAALLGVILTVIDWRHKRLPDALTLPSYLVVVAGIIPSGQLVTALACGAAIGGAYLVLWFAHPRGIGFGDVKLAGLIGLLSGAVSVDAALIAGLGGHVLGALYAIGLLATGRADRKGEFPFGPFMIAATLVAVLIR